MICPNCGTENRAGAKFCIGVRGAARGHLPDLRHDNPPAAKFCSECATPLGRRALGPTGRGARAAAPGAGAPGRDRR